MDERYSIEQAGGITTIRLRRRLSLEEMLAVVDEVAARDISSRRLWDLTRNLKFTGEEMRAIAARGRERWPGAARVAYLAADDLSFGLLRMFEVFREQDNYETRVFRDEAEARQWLARWVSPEGATAASTSDAATDAAARNDLLAEGQANWWKSADGVARRRQIEAEVRSRYATELELAGWFKEAWLELRIRREVITECAKVTPLDVLWAADDSSEDDRSGR